MISRTASRGMSLAMDPTPASDGSDEELAFRARQGCARSFERLMERFQVPVLHFLRRRGHVSDAEDLLQETFLRVCSNLHRYQRRWRFSTWLFTIARRVSINHGRRVRPAATAEVVFSAAPPPSCPLEAIVAEEERRGLWDRATRVLGREELTAVWLYYVEDMPVREIAVVLERSRVSVKTMLFRARRRLRDMLECLESDGGGSFRARTPQNRGEAACRSAEGSDV